MLWRALCLCLLGLFGVVFGEEYGGVGGGVHAVFHGRALPALEAAEAVTRAARAARGVERRCFPLLAGGASFALAYGEVGNASVREKANAAFSSAFGAGLDWIQVGATWGDLESTPNVINAAPILSILRLAREANLAAQVNLAAIDTNAVTVPPDLADPRDSSRLRPGLHWDDAEVVNRYSRFVSELAPLVAYYGGFYIGLGNEVDTVFASDPEQGFEFARFTAIVRSLVKNVTSGDMAVGVTFTSTGFKSMTERRWMKALVAASDETPITYFPLHPRTYEPLPPTSPRDDIPILLSRLEPSKCLLLQEVGYPSGFENRSSSDRSSAKKQAEFYENLFAALSRAVASEPNAATPRVRGVSAFMLIDFPKPICQDLVRHYHHTNPAFAEFLCTLGLVKADGTPKQALSTFVKAISKFHNTYPSQKRPKKQ